MFQITLKAARVNAELRQEEAAKLLNVTGKTLRNYEQGITAIPGHVLKKASIVYKISSDCIRLPIINDGKYDDDFF
ncbi:MULTISPECIES: helix-turn-helix domain-containing protein [Bacillus]|uniref:XRE family transcriptional regulator n=1 Tax=Bacillus thuringiensis TaxID=1428 RepID=A0AB36VB68_BACTU|nr:MULTISPECIES: helix-turn-helix transcriptional regulator [Bacillus]MBJ8123545.1 helix-turn-helix transcriptional regulator [Bacillus cereus]MDR4442186.1 helix-turn-helix transcriptional regulator [Bacillus cereus]PFT99315.1 XRE family transcriptional regulator [Bacillus thuringiensis]PGL61741.1 XRE family transcriptional regulator [Bacillus thuringiensis]PGN73972.1 XRE family transcriptional regulator [Bacillus cereus]